MSKKILFSLLILVGISHSLHAMNEVQSAGLGACLGAVIGFLTWQSQHDKWRLDAKLQQTTSEPMWYTYVGIGAVCGVPCGLGMRQLMGSWLSEKSDSESKQQNTDLNSAETELKWPDYFSEPYNREWQDGNTLYRAFVTEDQIIIYFRSETRKKVNDLVNTYFTSGGQTIDRSNKDWVRLVMSHRNYPNMDEFN